MNKKRETIQTALMIAMGSLFLLMMTAEAFHPAIVGDETFSMKLAENGYKDIVILTARDVHPPLYYFILKTVIGICALFSADPVTAGKIASVLPFFLLGIVFWTKVRRQYGRTAAGIAFLCVTGMPHMMKFAVEIRMYSWGMLFLVMAYLAFCDIVTEGISLRAGISFVISGLLAAYTHYFACLAAGFLYVALFAYCVVKERTWLKYWLGCCIVTAVCYLPWLPVLFRQMGGVKEGYWIEPVSLGTLAGYFQFLFNPAVYAYYSGTLLGIATFLLLAAAAAKSLFPKRGKGKEESGQADGSGRLRFCILAGMSQIFFVIAVGVLCSVLMKPVLVQRYLFFCTGVLWLAFAIGVSRLQSGRLQAGISVFLAVVTFLNGKAFIRTEEESRAGWKELEQVLEQVEADDVILGNFGQVRLALAYSMPETTVCYYWRQTTEDLFKGLYGNLEDTRDGEAVFAHLTDTNSIYYFDTLEIDEFHLQEDYPEEDIVFTDMGTCLIEDIRVRIYRVERGERYAGKGSGTLVL